MHTIKLETGGGERAQVASLLILFWIGSSQRRNPNGGDRLITFPCWFCVMVSASASSRIAVLSRGDKIKATKINRRDNTVIWPVVKTVSHNLSRPNKRVPQGRKGARSPTRGGREEGRMRGRVKSRREASVLRARWSS